MNAHAALMITNGRPIAFRPYWVVYRRATQPRVDPHPTENEQ